MKYWFLTTLMVVTVVLFLFLKISGRIRVSEMNPVSAIALKVVLFVASTAFVSISLIKVLHHFIAYNATPLDIIIYGATVLLAATIAFVTTAALTRD